MKTLFDNADASEVCRIAANQIWRSMRSIGHPDGTPKTMYSTAHPPIPGYQSKAKPGFFGNVATIGRQV